MNKFLLPVVLFIGALANIFASEPEINVSQNAIRINFENLTASDIRSMNFDSTRGYYRNFTFALTRGILPKISQKHTTNECAYETISDYIPQRIPSAQENISLQFIGSSAGIDLYSLHYFPVFSSKGTLLQATTQEISIDFPVSLAKNFAYPSNIGDLISPNILNGEHLSYLKFYHDSLAKIPSEALYKLGNPIDWYNPDLTYYKIETTEDAPVFFPLANLLAANPALTNQQSQYLHLLYMGKPEAYYTNDANGVLDATDTLYFIGKRPAGDTTWFDNYNAHATLYLTYDATSETKQFASAPSDFVPTAEVNQVFRTLHSEKDSLFTDGIRLEYAENISGEGWYHKPFTPNRDSIFTLHEEFYPVPDSTQIVTATFYCTKIDSLLVFNHKVQSNLNDLQTNTLNFAYITNDYYKVHTTYGNSGSFFFGDNALTYRSIGFPEYSDTVLLHDGLAFDYLEITGYSLPIVTNNKADFQVDAPAENSLLTLYPFKSANVIAFDSINNYKFTGESHRGDCFTINSTNGKVSFARNGETMNESARNGAHLLTYSPDTRQYEYSYFENIAKFVDQFNNTGNELTKFIAVNLSELSASDIALLRSIKFVVTNYNASDKIAGIRLAESEEFAVCSAGEGIAKSIIFCENPAGERYSYSIKLPAGKNYHIIASDTLSEVNIEQESVSNIKPDERNVMVITSRELAPAAQKYIDYRRQTHQELSFGIVFVEDIYKEFNAGKISPDAIKNFLRYAYKNWNTEKLQTAVIIGDACLDARKIFPYTKMTDHVPSFGNPISDNWYSWLDDPVPVTEIDGEGNVVITGYTEDLFPDILLSRIPVKSETEMNDYLEKTISFETSANAPWKSSMLYLTGGMDQYETVNFLYAYTYSISDIIQKSHLCTTSEFITKSQDGSTGISDGIKIIQAINEGKILTFFAGHGSPIVFDLDGWTPNSLSNKGKYGIFYTQSCNTAAFALPDCDSRFEEYLLSKNKGFVFCIGASATEDIRLANIVAKNFTDEIFNGTERNLLAAYNHAKVQAYSDYANVSPKGLYLIQFRGSTLGDPFLRMPQDTVPELYLLPEEFTVTNDAGSTIITEDSKFATLTFMARNLGIKNFDSVNVMIIDTYNNSSDTLYTILRSICPYEKIEFSLPVSNKTGLHFLTIKLDPENLIYEHRKDNNILSRQFEVLRNSLMSIEPLAYYDVQASKPVFRMLSPYSESDSAKYKFEILSETDDAAVVKSIEADVSISDNAVDWTPDITLSANKNFRLKASCEIPNSTSDNFTIIPFHTLGSAIARTVKHNVSGNFLADLESENMQFKDGKIAFASDSVYFDLIGINGTSENSDDVTRGAYLQIDGEYVLSVSHNSVGLHIVQYNKDFTDFRHKYFNTWGETSDGEAITDSASIFAVRYLRDSVKAENNLFIATRGQSFRLFSLHDKLHTEGSWDTLRTVLESYGAKMTYNIDTLTKKDNAWGISYVFATNNSDYDKRVFEHVNLTGDSARVTGWLPRYPLSGTVSHTISSIDTLQYFALQGENLSDKNSVEINIFGTPQEATAEELLYTQNGTEPITLSNTEKYCRSYRIECKFEKNGPEPNSLSISGLDARYIPLEEFGIYKNAELSDTLYAGDYDTLSIKVRNLSFRREADSVQIRSVVTNGETEIDRYETLFRRLSTNSIATLQTAFESDEYPNQIMVQTSADYPKTPDLYTFNNTLEHSQKFVPDTLKPEIHLELDGFEVHSGDNITMQPAFRAYFRDNSPRVIPASNNLRVRINTLYATADNTTGYEFISHPKGDSIKAELLFLPDTLDFDENIIRIYAEDANSNRDTAYYSLNVARNGAITHISIFPNPLEVSSTIEFDYHAPKQGGYAQIEIFNYYGQRINDYKMDMHIGKNQIPILITDKSNAPLPSGVYFYRVSILNTDILVEPITDKFVITR